ncbi:hypothetical protein QJQ45_028513 [Haematococcus lacustris]|nr:hypothetical protein QJQ45_028513 [Haematococcus lacustris]
MQQYQKLGLDPMQAYTAVHFRLGGSVGEAELWPLTNALTSLLRSIKCARQLGQKHNLTGDQAAHKLLLLTDHARLRTFLAEGFFTDVVSSPIVPYHFDMANEGLTGPVARSPLESLDRASRTLTHRANSDKMNELEVERQIENMCRFIKQEAEEKAGEIKVSAEEEFNLEKLQLLESEKARIRKDYERREAQVEVKKKIEYSKQLNEQRIKVLTARESAIQEIVAEAKLKLREVSKNPQTYKKLLTDLLVQAMKKLGEKSATIKCRQVDVVLVKDVMDTARKNFTGQFQSEAPVLTLDQTTFLPPPPQTAAADVVNSCCGGVVLVSSDGRITVSNTLDDRLKIAYEANLPEIRKRLFGDA